MGNLHFFLHYILFLFRKYIVYFKILHSIRLYLIYKSKTFLSQHVMWPKNVQTTLKNKTYNMDLHSTKN